MSKKSQPLWQRLLGTGVAAAVMTTVMIGNTSLAAADDTYNYAVKSTANVRVGPGTQHAVKGQVFAGEKVELICQDRGSTVKGSNLWDLINYRVDGTDGKYKTLWIHDSLLDTNRVSAVPGIQQGNCPAVRTTPGSLTPRPGTPPPTTTPPEPSRQQLLELAESVVYGGVGAGHLEAVRAQYTQFNPTTDGCSVPWQILKFPGLNWSLNNFSEVVLEACVIHDFGYRNFGQNGLRLDPTEDRRKTIDQAFLNNAHTLCNNAFPGGTWNLLAKRNRSACNTNAYFYYESIRLRGAGSFQEGS